jgi:hypothetical protein
MVLSPTQLLNQANILSVELSTKGGVFGITSADILSILLIASMLVEASMAEDEIEKSVNIANHTIVSLFNPSGDPC